MLQKFVYFTGMLDYLIGAATWGGAIYGVMTWNPDNAVILSGIFVALMTLGTFLMMAAALLMWASKDMQNRAPIIFWQGLVRLTAVCSVFYAVPAGMSEPWSYGVAVFDGIIAVTYIVGVMKVTGLSPLKLLLCKTT